MTVTNLATTQQRRHTMTKTWRAVLLTLALASTWACNDDDNDRPTSPSPTTMRTLSFAGNWPAERVDSPSVTGIGNALGLVWPGPSFSATDGKDGGAIWIAVKATGANVGQVRGEIRWDPALLTFDGYSEGEWFKQGGALVQWSLLTATPGQVGLLLDRPTTLPGATGTGTVIYVRLRGLALGTSALQWSDPALRGSDFSSRPLTGGTYGGTITVR